MKSKSQYLFHFNHLLIYALSAVSVFLGGVIYILYRPEKAGFFKVFDFIGLEKWSDLVREKTISVGQYLPEWFVYTLPNGLWAFAYSLLIMTIWRRSKSLLKYFWFATIPVLIFGFELLQSTGTIPGTFATGDIISGFAGIIAGILTIKIYRHEKNEV
jgi:hypothetical protein